MQVFAVRESRRVLGVAESWQAVIDSLSAGYRFLGRRVELILIPVLLDLWLWLGPQLSVAPLDGGFLCATMSGRPRMEGMPAIGPAGVAADAVGGSAQHSNLMDALVSGTLVHVPSLLATIGPTGAGTRVLRFAARWRRLGYSRG